VLEPFKKFEIVAFVASNSPLIGKRLTFKELAQIPLVVLRTSKTYMELIALGYDPNVAVPCDEPDAVKAMVPKRCGNRSDLPRCYSKFEDTDNLCRDAR